MSEEEKKKKGPIGKFLDRLSEANALEHPSFTAAKILGRPNSMTQQGVRDYFFVKFVMFCYLPFSTVVV